MEIDDKKMKSIINILKQMYDFSQREDWDESAAQFLIMDGGDLYAEYFRKKD